MRKQVEADSQAKFDKLISLLDKTAEKLECPEMANLLEEFKREVGKGLISISDITHTEHRCCDVTNEYINLIDELKKKIEAMNCCEDEGLSNAIKSYVKDVTGHFYSPPAKYKDGSLC